MINQINQVIKFTPPKRLGFWVSTLFFAASGGLLVLLIFAMLGYQLFYLNRAYPGVTLAGEPIGGLTKTEIAGQVSAQAGDHLRHPLTIEVGSEQWNFAAQELGLRVDVEATTSRAYEVGRRNNILVDMLTHLSLWSNPQNVELVFRFDEAALHQRLQQMAAAYNYPPQNARLILPPSAQVELVPGQRGRRMHLGATQPVVKAAVLNRQSEPLEAVTQEVIPPITTEDLQPVYQQAQTLLSRPLTFAYSTPTDAGQWEIPPETLVEMLRLIEEPGPTGRPQFRLELEQAKLAPYFEEFARVINIEPSNARLEFDDEAGELVILQQSRDGRTLDLAAAYDQTAQAIAQSASLIELPVQLRPATISSNEPEALGIETLISESTSYFKGSSQGRMDNIALAASRFQGVVIPPGEIFSFNEHLGPVTKEAGFDESLIIFGDRTTVGIGGGVCQVSTTVFRSAFYGGFEIVERWAHGYRVGWYETKSGPGLDATIYTPDVDFKFRNDTDHFLLIQTETDLEAGTLAFKFYGTPTDREVIVSEPEITNKVEHGPPVYEDNPELAEGVVKQVDWAKDGMDVTVTRLVKADDEIVHRDEIVSQYRPWRAVYQVGTDGQTPTESNP